MINRLFKPYRAVDFCTGKDLMALWNISGQDIVDFMRKGWLKAYKFIGNKNTIDLKYNVPNKNKTLSHVEKQVNKSIVIDRSSQEPIIVSGKINYNVVYRISKELSIDQQIKLARKSSSSYRPLTEDECKPIARLLYQAQPDTYFSLVITQNVKDPLVTTIALLLEGGSIPLKETAKDLYFNKDDVNSFAEEHCLPFVEQFCGDQVNVNELPNRQIQIEQQSINSAVNYFYREGNGWRIGFQGEKAVFDDYKYIRYISLLLDKKGTPIEALKLIHDVDGNLYQSEHMSEEQSLDEGLSTGRIYKDEEISGKKVREIESLLSEIDKETDPLIKQELQIKLDTIKKALKNMNAHVDDKGDPAPPPQKQKLDNPEKKNAQKSISAALDDAYAAFEKRKFKKLANHLKKNIVPAGNYNFWYRDIQTNWDIKL
jgi:hypothetical protein